MKENSAFCEYLKGAYAVQPHISSLQVVADYLAWYRRQLTHPHHMHDCIVFMPTNRARRHLINRLKTQGNGILPQIITLAHLEELHPTQQEAASYAQLFLTTLNIWEEENLFQGLKANRLDMAHEFLKLVDEIYIENLPFDKLHQLHLQHINFPLNLHDLQTLFFKLHDKLAAQNLVHPKRLQNEIADAIAHSWQAHPRQAPVIVAGSTGTVYATRTIMSATLNQPLGAVLFPACLAQNVQRDTMSVHHPFYTIHTTCKKLGTSLKPLPVTYNNPAFVSEYVSPIPNIQHVKSNPLPQNTTFLEVHNTTQEVETLKNLTLEAVHHKQPVTIICPDPYISDQLNDKLLEVGITADNSIGINFQRVRLYQFIQALYEVQVKNHGLALLHLLNFSHQDHITNLKNHIDLAYVRPNPNVFIHTFVGQLELYAQETLQPFLQKDTTLEQTIKQAATYLNVDFAPHEWAAFNEVSELLGNTHDQNNWHVLLHFLKQHTLRPNPSAEGAADVMILGPLEARMLAKGRVIVTSMNDDAWPSLNNRSLWNNRELRHYLGLPPVERRHALAAHDILQAFSGEEIYYVRSKKIQGGITLPSRWWEKLKIFFKLHQKKLPKRDEVIEWLSLPTARAATFQAPIITPHLLPAKLSVTAIDLWLQDPYSFYVKHVLNLRPLLNFGETQTHSQVGQLLHKIMEVTMRNPGADLDAIITTWPLANFYKAFLRPVISDMLRWATKVRNRSEIKTILTEKWIEASLVIGDHVITAYARPDRIDVMPSSQVILVDYKTSTIPSAAQILRFEHNQLAVEGLMLQQGALENKQPHHLILEYWSLRHKKITTVDQSHLENFAQHLMQRLAPYFKGEKRFDITKTMLNGFNAYYVSHFGRF